MCAPSFQVHGESTMGNASFRGNSAETGGSPSAELRLSSSLDYWEGNYTALVGSGEKQQQDVCTRYLEKSGTTVTKKLHVLNFVCVTYKHMIYITFRRIPFLPISLHISGMVPDFSDTVQNNNIITIIIFIIIHTFQHSESSVFSSLMSWLTFSCRLQQKGNKTKNL